METETGIKLSINKNAIYDVESDFVAFCSSITKFKSLSIKGKFISGLKEEIFFVIAII